MKNKNKNNNLILEPSVFSLYSSNKDNGCPFCNINELKSRDTFVDYGDGIYFFSNKFRTYKNTLNFLLLEGPDCNIGLHDRELSHILKLLNTSIDIKNEYLLNNPEFKDYAIFKQFGVYSSSSVEHGHIQIVFFDKPCIDYSSILNSLSGTELYKDDSGLKITLSDDPIGESNEFNIDYDILDINLVSKLVSILKYLVYSARGIYIGGNYSITLNDVDGRKFIKILERRISPTYKSAYGMSIINAHTDEYINFLKDILK